MKKLILSVAAVVAFAFTTEAQTRKGTILLGAGSDLTDTEWTDLKLTPRVGFFVQDGVAIGAIVNFNNRTQDQKESKDPNPQVSLSSSSMTLGAFVRYYVSNNVFAELEVSNESSTTGNFDHLSDFETNPVTNVTTATNARQSFDLSTSATNFGLGLGYTIVFKEHFAIEPFVKLRLVSGNEDIYVDDLLTDDATDLNKNDTDKHDFNIQNQKFNETNFNLGVNFSLFF